MKKKILVTATMALMVMTLVLPGGAASSLDETTRTSPYDLGCLNIWAWVCVPSDEARNGTLRGGKIPMVTVTYSIPPFPVITTWEFSSQAGIYVDVTEHSFIRFSATVRKAGPADPTAVDVKACIAYTPPGSVLSLGEYPIGFFTYGGTACTPVPADGQATDVTTAFETSIRGRDGFEPGRYSFWVHLRGGLGSFGEVQVDSMSYIIESGDTTPPTNPALSSP